MEPTLQLEKINAIKCRSLIQHSLDYFKSDQRPNSKNSWGLRTRPDVIESLENFSNSLLKNLKTGKLRPDQPLNKEVCANFLNILFGQQAYEDQKANAALSSLRLQLIAFSPEDHEPEHEYSGYQEEIGSLVKELYAVNMLSQSLLQNIYNSIRTVENASIENDRYLTLADQIFPMSDEMVSLRKKLRSSLICQNLTEITHIINLCRSADRKIKEPSDCFLHPLLVKELLKVLVKISISVPSSSEAAISQHTRIGLSNIMLKKDLFYFFAYLIQTPGSAPLLREVVRHGILKELWLADCAQEFFHYLLEPRREKKLSLLLSLDSESLKDALYCLSTLARCYSPLVEHTKSKELQRCWDLIVRGPKKDRIDVRGLAKVLKALRHFKSRHRLELPITDKILKFLFNKESRLQPKDLNCLEKQLRMLSDTQCVPEYSLEDVGSLLLPSKIYRSERLTSFFYHNKFQTTKGTFTVYLESEGEKLSRKLFADQVVFEKLTAISDGKKMQAYLRELYNTVQEKKDLSSVGSVQSSIGLFDSFWCEDESSKQAYELKEGIAKPALTSEEAKKTIEWVLQYYQGLPVLYTEDGIEFDLSNAEAEEVKKEEIKLAAAKVNSLLKTFPELRDTLGLPPVYTQASPRPSRS